MNPRELKKALVSSGFEVFRTMPDHVVLAERPRENLILDSGVRVRALDEGQGFEFDAASHASTRSPLEDRGRGLILMQALVDNLQFIQAEDGRHRVTLEKRLSPQPHLRLLAD